MNLKYEFLHKSRCHVYFSYQLFASLYNITPQLAIQQTNLLNSSHLSDSKTYCRQGKFNTFTCYNLLPLAHGLVISREITQTYKIL